MSTLADRSAEALLVIDVQRDVFVDAVDRDAVVANIASLVDRARAAGTPVVWIRHSEDEMPQGSDGWQIVDELVPEPGEAIVEKTFRDSFDDTDLEERLAERDVAHLVVVGGQTDFCVRSTLHGALIRGYDVTLVGDAHATVDLREWWPEVPAPAAVIAHTNAYWAGQRAPGRTAAVVATADVTFA